MPNVCAYARKLGWTWCADIKALYISAEISRLDHECFCVIRLHVSVIVSLEDFPVPSEHTKPILVQSFELPGRISRIRECQLN
jgi:hypothetical protein